MSITAFITESITYLIDTIGYSGIFILMTLESALIPIPSEIIMPFSGFLVCMGKMNLFLAISAGALGNLLGSIIAYWLGLKFGRGLIIRYGKCFLVDSHHLKMVEDFFEKHGEIAIFIGRLLPAIRTIISFPAGVSKMRLGTFTVYTLIGSYIWNIFLVYLGIILRERWELIQSFFEIIDIIIIVCLLAFLIYIYVKYKGVNQREQGP